LFTDGLPDPADGSPAGVAIGYNTSSGYGFIQAIQTGVANKDLYVQPSGANNVIIANSGGNVGIGSSTPSFVTGSGLEIQRTSADATLRLEHTGANAFELSTESTQVTYNSVSSKPHVFEIGSSPKMTLDASGNLLVGKSNTTFSTSGIELREGNSGARFIRSNAEPILINRTGSDGKALGIYKDGTEVGSISVTGSATTYNTSSDQRLKDNIVDAPSASDDIDAIQVRSFDWKADGSHQKYGMVAQELQSVAPEAVTGDADSDDMMGVDYSKLVPMLVKEIQSLRARVAQLEGAN